MLPFEKIVLHGAGREKIFNGVPAATDYPEGQYKNISGGRFLRDRRGEKRIGKGQDQALLTHAAGNEENERFGIGFAPGTAARKGKRRPKKKTDK